jgi:shikimate 5-dehydrogenase
MLARLNLQERVPVVMDVVYKPARTPLLQQVPIL